MIKESIHSFKYYLLGAFIAFSFQMIGAWYLGSTEYGKANYYLGFALTIFTFASFGVQFFLPKYLHELKNPKQFVNRSFWTITILFLVLSPVMAFLLSLKMEIEYILIIILLSYMMIIFGLFRAYHNGVFDTKRSYFLYFALEGLTLIIFIILIFIFSNFIIYILAIMIGYLIINSYEFYQLITKNVIFDKKIVYLSLPFYYVQITYGIFPSLSRIIQKEFSSYEMVGILSISLVLGGIVTMFGSVIAQVVMPSFSRSWANKDYTQITNIFHDSTRINAYIILPLAIFTLINSEKILNLFGKGYVGGSIILCLIFISSFFGSIVGPNGTLLNMSNNQRYEILNGILGLIGAILITIIFAPIFFWGVAFAIAMSEIIRNCAKTIEIHNIFGFWPFNHNIFKYLCIVCFFQSLFFILFRYISDPSIWLVVNSLTVFLAIVFNYYFSPMTQDRTLIFSILSQVRNKLLN